MNCRHARNLFSDYVDGELKEDVQRALSGHLKGCPSCRNLEESLRNYALKPFRTSVKSEAPPYLWDRIEKAIGKSEEKGIFKKTSLRWTELLSLKKPILVPAVVTLFLLVAVLFVTRPMMTERAVNSYLDEEMQFISELASNGYESYLGIKDVNLGTSIEEFLL